MGQQFPLLITNFKIFFERAGRKLEHLLNPYLQVKTIGDPQVCQTSKACKQKPLFLTFLQRHPTSPQSQLPLHGFFLHVPNLTGRFSAPCSPTFSTHVRLTHFCFFNSRSTAVKYCKSNIVYICSIQTEKSNGCFR